MTAAIAPHVSAGTRRSRGSPRPRPAGLYVARPWPAEHDRLYCPLARHTPKRLASAASRRPEGQPVNHDADAPRHQPQDPIDDGQWPRQDQEKDRDEAAMVAALADDDDLRTLPTHCSRRAELGSYPSLLRRPPHPGARSGRVGHLSLHSRLTGRRARHRWAALVRHRPRLGLTSGSH